MAQRSPSNARYQKHTKPAGKTRKSAAAAKPKRSGSPASSSSSKKQPARRTIAPFPEELKVWRNVSYVLIALAIATSLLSLTIARDVKPWNTVTLVAAYVFMGGFIAIDFLKIRPARRDQLAGKSAPPKKKPEKADASEDDSSDTQG